MRVETTSTWVDDLAEVTPEQLEYLKSRVQMPETVKPIDVWDGESLNGRCQPVCDICSAEVPLVAELTGSLNGMYICSQCLHDALQMLKAAENKRVLAAKIFV